MRSPAISLRTSHPSPKKGNFFQMNVFAEIIEGKRECFKIFETADCIAILDLFPCTPGHSLLIPKVRSFETVEEMDAPICANVLQHLPRLCKIVREATGADGVNIISNNGKCAGQRVFHVHFHVIPRFNNDKLNLKMPRSRTKPIEKKEALEMLSRMMKSKIKEEEEEEQEEKTDTTTLPQERGELMSMFEKWKSSPSESERANLCLSILTEHPFVRAKTKVTIEHELHTFEIQGFATNPYKLRKWLKTGDGKQFSSVGGGVSDDALYTLSPMLRVLLPRGLHFVRVKQKGQDEFQQSFFFRGIPKFTGLTAQDEDEVSNSHQHSFLYKDYKMNDAHGFYETLKSNGENAKLSLRVLNDVVYLISGSKGTCMIWPAESPSSKFYDVETPMSFANAKKSGSLEAANVFVGSKFDSGAHIANAYSNWYLHTLNEQGRKNFVHSFLKNNFQTIMGEINRPWGEHMIPISEPYLEVYSVLQGQDALPISPKSAFDYFQSLGLKSKHGSFRHVPFTSHRIQDLKTRLQIIRSSKNNEGAVLYLFDKKGTTVGLVKVKATDYVVRRRLRESLSATLITKVFKGDVEGFPPHSIFSSSSSSSKNNNSKKNRNRKTSLDDIVKKNEKLLPLKMSRLTHVPNHKVESPKWGRYAVDFMHWWIRTRIAKYDEDKKKFVVIDDSKAYHFAYYEWKQRYGSLLEEFERAGGDVVSK